MENNAQSVDQFELTGWLPRFVDREIEEHYLEHDYTSAARTRLMCYLLGAALTALNPFTAHTMLAHNPELVVYFLWGGMGLDLPVFLLSAWLSTRKTVAVRTASLLLLALLTAVEGQAEFFRILGAFHGADFPSSTSLIGFCIAVLVFGFPLRYGLLTMSVFFVAAKTAEFALLAQTPQNYSAFSMDVVLLVLTIVATVRADTGRREAFSRLVLSEQRAYVDQLTGLSNRWGFKKDAERIVRHAVRERHPITVAVVDLDRFKQLNDSAGHAFGDFVLSQIGRCLGQHVRRPLDVVARMGGEEFALLWYAPREDFSADVGSQVVASVRALAIQRPDGSGTCVTVSAGVATALPKDVKDLDGIMEAADRCLYQAKAAGRDRSHFTVVAADKG
ncbi:MAG: GGDEF domain-containing protein [Nevskia sp.]|nr:GGDEF domain-containing protein [Nevskia sp.]